MKIGILSRNRNLYSTRRLWEAGRKRGHRVDVIDTMSVVVEMGQLDANQLIKVMNQRPSIISASAWGFSSRAVRYLPPLDAVVPRIGATVTEYGLAVVRQFEARGVFTAASSVGIGHSRDKLVSLQLMQQRGLPIPKTAVIDQTVSLGVAMKAVGGPPAIIKMTRGTQGRGVIFVRSMSEAVNVVQKLKLTNKQLLLQEFLPEARGKDIRVLVVNGVCVAAMQRQAPKGDFRANLHLGGTAVSLPITPEISELALTATETHQLHVAGVDLIQSDRGLLLLEVNSSPGLEGIETITQKDIAGEIIRFIETAVDSP